MVEEPEKKETLPPPEKLMLDDASNFRFHAAYLTYCELFDKSTSPETKRQLNESIKTLKSSGEDYAAFYESIGRFRGENAAQHGFGRAFIKTQKKKEWRRKAQKHDRIARHKK